MPRKKKPSKKPSAAKLKPPAPGVPSRLSSSELQNRLLAAVKQLSEAPNLDALRNKRLDEFWGKEAVQEPFLQCLTFQQFITLDASVLVKKRSFTEQKALALIEAIHTAIGDCNGPEKHATDWKQTRTAPIEKATIQETAVSWKQGALEIPVYIQGFLRFYEEQCKRCSAQDGALSTLLHNVPKVITADDAAISVLAFEQGVEGAAMGMGCDAEHAQKAIYRAADILKQLMDTLVPQLKAHWISALNSPGVREDALLAPYAIKGVDMTLQKLLVRLCVKGLGATHPRVGDTTLDFHWCIDERALALILKGLQSSFPISDAKLREDIRSLLPAFEEDEIIECMGNLAELDEEKGVWQNKTL